MTTYSVWQSIKLNTKTYKINARILEGIKMKISQKDIGKLVTFKSRTRLNDCEATRIIKVVNKDTIEVDYNGWGDFIVYLDEIIKIERDKDNDKIN